LINTIFPSHFRSSNSSYAIQFSVKYIFLRVLFLFIRIKCLAHANLLTVMYLTMFETGRVLCMKIYHNTVILLPSWYVKSYQMSVTFSSSTSHEFCSCVFSGCESSPSARLDKTWAVEWRNQKWDYCQWRLSSGTKK
jgi:hypothetical protein